MRGRGMEGLIFFVLSNFTLTLFVVGLVVSGVVLATKPKPLSAPVVAEASGLAT